MICLNAVTAVRLHLRGMYRHDLDRLEFIVKKSVRISTSPIPNTGNSSKKQVTKISEFSSFWRFRVL